MVTLTNAIREYKKIPDFCCKHGCTCVYGCYKPAQVMKVIEQEDLSSIASKISSTFVLSLWQTLKQQLFVENSKKSSQNQGFVMAIIFYFDNIFCNTFWLFPKLPSVIMLRVRFHLLFFPISLFQYSRVEYQVVFASIKLVNLQAQPYTFQKLLAINPLPRGQRAILKTDIYTSLIYCNHGQALSSSPPTKITSPG